MAVPRRAAGGGRGGARAGRARGRRPRARLGPRLGRRDRRRPRAHQRARAARRRGRGPARRRRGRARPRGRRRRRPRRRGDRGRHRRRAAVAWEPGRVEELAPGLPVFALADPGGRGLRTTFGLVTATGRSFRGPRGRRIGGSIEHSAPLPRGSSGGPLVDADGPPARHQHGAHGGRAAARAARPTRRCAAASTRSAAARRRRARGWAWRSRRRAPRARLRAAVGLPERDGLLVRGVEPGSPADARRPERGDLLVAAGGRPLDGFDDLFDALEAGGRLALTVVRGTEEREVIAHFSL